MKALYLTPIQHRMLKHLLENLLETQQCDNGHVHVGFESYDAKEIKEFQHRAEHFTQDLN